MTNNTSTFTPSTQIIEAGQQLQATANELRKAELNTPQVVAPFVNPTPPLSPVVEGAGWLIEQAGNGLRSLGFDEAELEVTTSDVELTPTDHSPVVDNLNPTWGDLVPDSLRPSTYVIEGGQVLQETGWKGTGEAIETAGQVMRAFGFDEAEADGLTGTGPMMPAFDEDEPLKYSEKLKGTAGIVGAVGGILGATGGGAPAGAAAGVAAGVLYIGGTILGAFGLDVDESEPYIPEVGVDALA